MDTDPWDFYYVDEQLLRMYFTLIPEADQATFRSRAFTNQPAFEIGLQPKIQTTRYRPELPHDQLLDTKLGQLSVLYPLYLRRRGGSA